MVQPPFYGVDHLISYTSLLLELSKLVLSKYQSDINYFLQLLHNFLYKKVDHN